VPNTGRLTDMTTGICCCHSSPRCISTSGIVITGSPNVAVNGLPAGRITDMVLAFCGHTGFMITGSSTVLANGLGKIRIGDMHVGCYKGVVVTGSPNVITGG